jgi:hypothetical protein
MMMQASKNGNVKNGLVKSQYVNYERDWILDEKRFIHDLRLISFNIFYTFKRLNDFFLYFSVLVQ